MTYESESLRGDGSSNDSTSNPALNVITLGEWMQGNLATASDVDYFKFTANAGLLTLQLQTPDDSVLRWKVELFDLNGDYIRAFTRSVTGSLSAIRSGTTGTDVEVSGLTSTVPLGSQFTTVTSSADTKIYTVLSTNGYAGGKSTLTLDTAFTSTSSLSIAFDPAQYLATGGLASYTALLDQAGGYYLKVSPLSWTAAPYAVNLNIQASNEVSGANDSIATAIDSHANLAPNLNHQGELNNTNDKSDVWLFSTATASNFNFEFKGTNSDSSFNLKLQAWDAINSVWVDAHASSGSLLNATSVSGTKSLSIDKTVYPTGTSFALTVSPSNLAATAGAGRYTLSALGVGLDANDTPVILVDGHAAIQANSTLDLTSGDQAVIHTYKQGATTKVALSSLFTATDADTGQTLTYKAWLEKPAGSTASIKVGDSVYDGSTALTAAQLQTAYVYTGSQTGDLTLTVQATDSSNAPDYTGVSSFVMQTLRVVSSSIGVNITAPATGSRALTEGGASKTISLNLTSEPTQDVSVYILQDDLQFDLSSSVMLFKAGATSGQTGYYATPQSITLSAKDDGKTEGAGIPASLKFQVVSQDANYKGLALDSQTFTISDPANHAHTGTVTLSTNPAQASSVTLTSSLADADGIGLFNYTWQSAATANASENQWQSITDATAMQYTPTASDVGKFLRVKVSYTDARGYAETETSAASNAAVLKTNEAPSTQDHVLNLARSDTYTFSSADFPFNDPDANDALSAIALMGLPLNGQLTLKHNSFTIPDGGFLISAAELLAGDLQFVPSTNKTGSVSDVVSFKVFDSKDTSSTASADLTLNASSRPTASNSQVDGVKNTPIVLTVQNFNFSDSDTTDHFQSIKITQLPSVGTLKLSGVNVTNNQIIDAADIAARHLTFLPATDSTGKNYDHFQFKVSDGTVESSAAYNFNLRVATTANATTWGVDISGHVMHWKGTAPTPITGVTVPVGTSTTATTGYLGEFSIPGVELNATSNVTPSVSTPFADKTAAGITLTDVLATLKVYLGRDLPSDYASPFNVVAADFDGNGVVNLSDVLGLLKYYLGRPSSLTPTWAFVDAADLVTVNGQQKIIGANGYLSKTDTTLDAVHVSPDQTTSVEIIGVIRGDVDGSWSLIHS